MIIILGIIGLMVIFYIVSHFVGRYSRGPIVALTSIIGGVFLFTIGIIVLESYGSYLNCRSFWDCTVEQYHGSIEMYGDKARLTVNEETFTDFRYQGYQENMAAFIKDLRTKMVAYNDMVIQKRKMEENPFFNWIIVAPDPDMKLLTMR